MSTSLVTHAGASQVSREQLDAFEPPPATDTWYPLKHSYVLDTVLEQLKAASFVPTRTQLAVTRGGSRFFATVDLSAGLGHGTHLAVGIRNSMDKSLPIGFAAGSRVFVCDNLAFRSEIVVARKHTRNGQIRFAESLTRAVTSLNQFKEAEAERIRRMQYMDLSEDTANSYMLRAFETKLVSHTLLRQVIAEWRNPSFEEFQPRTAWSLVNAFTTVLGSTRLKTNPQQYAHTTIAVQALLDGKPVQAEVVADMA